MPAYANCFMATCTFRQVQPAELFSYSDVSASGGTVENLRPPRSGNLFADVKKVQEVLNKIPADQGGQALPGGGEGLAEDGIAGKFTRTAIVAFQRKQFPDKIPDCIVEKDKRTIYRLNELAFPTESLAPIKRYLSS